jgi:glycosyltransferase involved in cell wall biosynthesis
LYCCVLATATGSGTIDNLRVTHVVHDLNGGGFETLIASMARLEAGTSVTVSAISLSGRVGRVGAAITPILDQYHVLKLVPLASMLWPRRLAAIIRRTRADVVHIHSGCWYKGSLAAKHAGVPVVYTEHGREHHDPPLRQWLDRRATRRTAAVAAVSDRLARYMERVLDVPSARMHVIQNGVDTDLFMPGPAPEALRARFGIPADALVVGSIGRLEPVKAYARLIDAVAAMRARSPERPVAGIIWGDGSARAELEARIAERGLAGSFHLPGWTDDATEAHRLLDVFALTSLSEGASVSLMESMASGVTPLVMDVGANAEVAGPELKAQVVPADDEAAFTAALEATLRDSARRATAGAAGRRQVVARYSLAAMVRAYEDLYRSVARPARNRPR